MWRKHAASLIEGIRLREPEGGISLSHTLEEQIRGQLQAGFRLVDCYEDTYGEGRLHDLNIPTFWATYAVKVG